MRKANKRMPKALKDVVLWKLETMPDDMRLSMDGGIFSREELKEHVKKEDKIGVLFSQMQLNFMKALASGEFTKALAQ